MTAIRKHGAAPILILVPAVAGMYLATGCGVPAPPSGIGTASTTTSVTFPTTTASSAPPQPLVSPTVASPTDPADSEYAAVCADAATGARVEDTECDGATETYTGDDSSAARPAAA